MSARTLLSNWFAPYLIDNLNKQSAMQRAASAQAQGLDPAQYGAPLPGSNITNTTTNNNGAAGLLKGVLLTAGLLAAGLAGGWLLQQHASPPAPAPAVAPAPPGKPTTKPSTAPATAPAAKPLSPFEVRVPWQYKDGKVIWGQPQVTPAQ